ncbi:MAG TPA: hypothetical protein VFU22_33835 [Roseiflexaceae bacterium]|nr:hypothetical protein [Roseiflexaceae bacterium]
MQTAVYHPSWRAERAECGLYYPRRSAAYATIANYIAIYASAMDACYVDGELVQPQEGDFYGGWITKEIGGPFKGGAGTSR